MNTERAIREAVEDHYGCLYELNADFGTEALSMLEQALNQEPEFQPLIDLNSYFYRRWRVNYPY